MRTLILAAALAASAAPAARAQNAVEHPRFPPPPPERQAPAVERNLHTFDVLDFDVFSNQRWDRLHESHTDGVIVTWPDGHETQGIARHIDDLKALFTYAPDITIKTHPIRFGSGGWTGVSGVMTGTFTRPMRTPDGRVIQPTGRRFALPMATLAHWTGGKMDHEWLFWDSQFFNQQLGIAAAAPQGGSMDTTAATDVVTLASSHPPGATLDRLADLAKARGMAVFARIEFSRDAATAGLEMPEMAQLVFGNPRGGTPLLKAAPLSGLDLPLHALAWADAQGKSWLSFHDPQALAARLGVADSLVEPLLGVRALCQAAAGG